MEDNAKTKIIRSGSVPKDKKPTILGSKSKRATDNKKTTTINNRRKSDGDSG
jgi:hypothetical protein